jgi:hypothetical protein
MHATPLILKLIVGFFSARPIVAARRHAMGRTFSNSKLEFGIGRMPPMQAAGVSCLARK